MKQNDLSDLIRSILYRGIMYMNYRLVLLCLRHGVAREPVIFCLWELSTRFSLYSGKLTI